MNIYALIFVSVFSANQTGTFSKHVLHVEVVSASTEAVCMEHGRRRHLEFREKRVLAVVAGNELQIRCVKLEDIK